MRTTIVREGDDEVVLHLRGGRTSADARPYQYSATIRRKETTPEDVQPKRDRNLQATLCALININGIMAYTLFDSGSTTDSVSPEFAHVTQSQLVKLTEQIILQLGCAGSRSKINYGTWDPVQLGSSDKSTVYFDIVNLDRYDCVIGTPFMNAHGVVLDFGRRVIVVDGQTIPAFTAAEDSEYRTKRRENRRPQTPNRSRRQD
ncbi:hypothetical protein OH77DRAFT_1448834 [Trametes cingulata]|nr:hypothetical protein OH77DRAFT_1448834 [Trametes cingulata]